MYIYNIIIQHMHMHYINMHACIDLNVVTHDAFCDLTSKLAVYSFQASIRICIQTYTHGLYIYTE